MAPYVQAKPTEEVGSLRYGESEREYTTLLFDNEKIINQLAPKVRGRDG